MVFKDKILLFLIKIGVWRSEDAVKRLQESRIKLCKDKLTKTDEEIKQILDEEKK